MKLCTILIRISCEFASDFLEKRFHYCRLLQLRNPVKNLRIAELRRMRNPPQMSNDQLHELR